MKFSQWKRLALFAGLLAVIVGVMAPTADAQNCPGGICYGRNAPAALQGYAAGPVVVSEAAPVVAPPAPVIYGPAPVIHYGVPVRSCRPRPYIVPVRHAAGYCGSRRWSVGVSIGRQCGGGSCGYRRF